jgi:hypothetical protein
MRAVNRILVLGESGSGNAARKDPQNMCASLRLSALQASLRLFTVLRQLQSQADQGASRPPPA